VKFESFKNEFEKEFKKKTPKPFSPLPFSLLVHPSPSPFFFFSLSFPSAREAKQAADLSPASVYARAPAAHVAQHAIPPAQLTPTLFFLHPVADRWGPAVRLPLPLAGGSTAPRFMAVGRYRPVPTLPRLQTPPLSRSKAPLHSPAITRPFPILNPPS
jgi:hypothetical protein